MGTRRFALRYLDPNEYYDLVESILKKELKEKKYMKVIVDNLDENLKRSGIEWDIDGRPKIFTVYIGKW